MQTLHARRKWQKISPNLEKDDVVLVKDKDVPHNDWHLGRVQEVHHGNDRLVRSITLQSSRNKHDVVGPIHKLVLLCKAR